MVKKECKYSEITEKIIGCALKVHQRMRSGYPELPGSSLKLFRALNRELGLLINFDSKSLEVKRLINNKYKPSFESNKSV